MLPTLLPFVGVLALSGLVSLYLHTRPVVKGTVIAKSETIETQPDGGWEYHFRATVQYTRLGEVESRHEQLTTNEEGYDSLSVGDEIGVRYWNAGGLFDFARLSDRSTVQMVLDAEVHYFVLLLGWLVGKRLVKKPPVLFWHGCLCCGRFLDAGAGAGSAHAADGQSPGTN